MPRILRIITRLNRGGPSRCVINLADRLRAEGFQTLVAAGRPEPGEGDMLRELAATGVPFEPVEDLQRGLNPVKDLSALAAIRKLIASYRPDIVHTHTAKAGLLGRRAAEALKPSPVRVHTFHGHVLDGYFDPVRSGVFRRMERRWARSTDALIAVAPSVRDELLHHHGVGQAAQYRVIPSGLPELDLEGVDSLRGELGLGEAPVIGFVGRLVPIKGFQEFLEAIPLVLKVVPHARFLVVGDGPLARQARVLKKRAPYKDALVLAGLRTAREPVFKTLDLLVLPSRKEGLPTVLLEAALAGVPVAASRIPGVTDLLDEMEEALLFDPRSVEAMAGAMIRLAEDRVLAGRMACKARKKVRKTVPAYSEVARRHARLYQSLLESGTRSASARTIL
ncbi:MAG: glycosyltransferase [Planctomycetes bacterium]|nr:glycosyltransferase [Planctomycetota bacterium]